MPWISLALASLAWAPTTRPHGLMVLNRASPLRSPAAPILLENPLANIFGGDKKKKQESALTTGFDALFKDAPLPVKMMAGLMKPLVGSLGAAIQESQADADELLQEAQNALRVDGNAAALLGANIQIGSVFSTSSSSSNINGQVRKMVMLQAQCAGTAGSGVVAIRGESDGRAIQVASLQLQAGGQVINVPTLRGGGGGGMGGGSGVGTDGVIDVDVM